MLQSSKTLRSLQRQASSTKAVSGKVVKTAGKFGKKVSKSVTSKITPYHAELGAIIRKETNEFDDLCLICKQLKQNIDQIR